MSRKCFFLFLLISVSLFRSTSAAEQLKVPEPLKPWTDWVLHDHQDELLCTPNYNDPDDFRCNWPTSLDLDIRPGKAYFKQKWHLEHESWLQLPGNETNWPEQVLINEKPALVLKRQGVPSVRLPASSYDIKGSFRWESIPEYLQINKRTGLLTLKKNGTRIEFPNLDRSGKVWLHVEKQTKKEIEDTLQIRAFRMIDDKIPTRVVLELNLDAAGSAREVLLGTPFTTDKFIPIALNSSLPARLEKDGRLRLQIRPGRWLLTLTVRHVGPLTSLKFDRPNDEYWPDREIWVFAKSNTRIVEIEGVPAIDPQQTSLPPKWRNLPAYKLAAGDEIKFKIIQQGNPEPPPDQLSLKRELWLRFDGSGYTIRDNISGKKTSEWRLEMAPPIELGRIAADGDEQFITKIEGTDKRGIELRNGLVEITADSQYQGPIGKIPAIGWDQDFQEVSARLFLPPGYRLVHAAGIDNIPATWLNRWTLLDIFILLIFTVSLAKLYSLPMASLGFFTMAILYHEPGAPKWIWLAILIGIALIRTVPTGKFLKAVKIYHKLVFLILILITIPFSIQHLRVGIYPQLEKPWLAVGKFQPPRPTAAPPLSEQKQQEPEPDDLMVKSASEIAKFEKRAVSRLKEGYSGRPATGYYTDKQVAQFDSTMVNQTGPGIPGWQWNTVRMSWSGPVKRDQQIGLFLIGPRAFMLLAFLRVGLIILLALKLLGVKYSRSDGILFPDRKNFLLIILLFLPFIVPAQTNAAEIPSPELFKELRNRLLEKDECFPNCADIQIMSLEITPDNLTLELEVAAAVKTAIPLPGHPQHWLADTVKIDSLPAKAIYSTSQSLWMIVPTGRHKISLGGKIPPGNILQLALPLKPHRLEVKQSGWIMTGSSRDGSIDNQLHFKRLIRKEEKTDNRILETGVLPPFVEIERFFRLGLDWRIETTVTRISPSGSALIIEYPLLPSEAVLSGNIKPERNIARINLDPRETYLKFDSIIDKTEKLLLKHAQTKEWTETWRIDASPIFHMEYDGPPVILHQVGNRWAPKWRPWPGEKLQLTITRPLGVVGQTVTIDKSRLAVNSGQRATDAKLEFDLRSSRGGQQTIKLPADSILQEVMIDNRVQTIRQEGRLVTVPIAPGKQKIALRWRGNHGITTNYETPEIDLGLPGANSGIELKLPGNRWPLMVYGPAIGPAILFWSVLVVIILAAYGLHKSRLTPLNFHQWLLLGIGLSQSNLIGALIVVGWLVAIEFRRKIKPDIDKETFNLMQICLGTLTILAILTLIVAINRGLLGHPDMSIVGNGSNRNLLRWYQDYSGAILPRAHLLSIPILWYRLAMLAWALWISFTLIGILRYGWQAFSKPVFWHSTAIGKKFPGNKSDSRKNADSEIDLTEEMQGEEGMDDNNHDKR